MSEKEQDCRGLLTESNLGGEKVQRSSRFWRFVDWIAFLAVQILAAVVRAKRRMGQLVGLLLADLDAG